MIFRVSRQRQNPFVYPGTVWFKKAAGANMGKEPLKHQAYQIIKDNIVNCVYAPGTVINEERIRAEVSASRTPIRDALSRLEQEGLVKILPKKGVEISRITVHDINMVYEARNLLEPYVVKNYGNRIPPETYMHYYRLYSDYLNKKIPVYSYSDMDDSFHQLFIDACDNSYFINLYSTIGNQIRRTRILSGQTSTDRLHETIEEHIAIVEAALKNDWKEAASAMVHHLSRSKTVMFDYILKETEGSE